MSNALATSTLIDQVEAAIGAAWAGLTKVYWGRPRETPTPDSLPYAVGIIDAIQITDDTALQMEQSYSLRIIGRFANPVDPTSIIEIEKSTRASELIARLQPGATFGNFYLPKVTNVDFAESDEVPEDAYEVTATFTCSYTVDHH